MGLLGGIRHVLGNLGFFPLTIAIGRIAVGLHPYQVYNTLEITLRAPGKLNRDGGAAEKRLDALERAVEAGALAIEFVDDQRARQLEVVGKRPHLFGLHFDSGHGIHHDQRGVGGDERGPRVIDKDVVAGRIQKVDLGLLPLGVSQRGGNGDLALDLLLVEIRNGVAFIDPRQPVGGARGIQQAGGERGLAGIAVAHHTDVPDVPAFVDFH